ncbi:MAG: tetratricopeptide repeat protein [Thiobacillaceae bacterium]
MRSAATTLFLALGLFTLNATACDLSPSEQMVNDAVQTNPQNASAWNALGHVQYMKGCHAEAREALLRAVLLDPTQATAWRNLGLADLKLDLMEEAVAALTMWRTEKSANLAAAK